MLSNYCNHQILVLMLLSLVGWNSPSTPAVDCVRDQSKIVRTIISKKILPILYRYSVTMPEDCPFFQGYDLFGWHERHKIKMYSTPSVGWKCGLCGKMFETESDLESHFDQAHSGNNDLKNKSVCLADYCDIMRCDVFKPLLDATSTEGDFLLSVNQSEEPDDWKERCSEKMQQKLKSKCTAIIKNCISGLLIGLSLKDFQDIEEDLNIAICSYLTCQKYWEYSLFEEKRVPLLSYLLIGGILAGGVWLLWYQFIWFYFCGTEKNQEYFKWIFRSNSQMETSLEKLESLRDRMNRQERAAPIIVPRIPNNKYNGLAFRKRQYNLLRKLYDYENENNLRYSKRSSPANSNYVKDFYTYK